MVWFVLAIILWVVALLAIIATFISSSKGATIATFLGATVLGFLLFFFSAFYQNGVGEAKVVVNSVDRNVVRTVTAPGAGFKAPWEDFIDFDLFSQDLIYAGAPGNTPEYSKGSVSGAEVTVSVGGIAGGSTQANVDMTVVYNIDGNAVQSIYEQYRSQERFTQMIVEKQVLDTARQIPSGYTAIEFRGGKRGEVANAIMDQLNERLGKHGVNVTAVTIQDVRYSAQVEEALTGLEVAAQNKEKAELEAEAKVTAAKGDADAKIEAARGEAEANREIAWNSYSCGHQEVLGKV